MSAKNVFTQEQQEALDLLATTTSVASLQGREKNLVTNLLADCVANPAVNTAVREKLRLTGLEVQPHAQVLNLAFNARHYEKFTQIYQTFSEQFVEIQRMGKLSEEQPLAVVLHNYAVIRGMARLFNEFNQLQEKGLLTGNATLLDLHAKIKNCHDMINVLDKQFAVAVAQKPGLFAAKEERPQAYFQSLLVAFNASIEPKQQLRPS